jgi:hypothetical protein
MAAAGVSVKVLTGDNEIVTRHDENRGDRTSQAVDVE